MNAQLLVTWLAAAILSWTPGYARTWARTAHVESVARELLTTSFDADELPIYPGDHGRARTALLVAAVASQEDAFDARVQAGDCRGLGGCDGGKAACYMQIHANEYGGIALQGGEWIHATELPGWGKRANHGEYYLNDDLRGEGHDMACFLVGQHMLRKAMRISGRSNICNYTGEMGPCPKGDWRQGLADRWYVAHAPPVNDVDVLGSDNPSE